MIASEDCQIGQPEARAQGTAANFALWPYTIGLRRTKELLFTGYTIDGITAESWGMINHAVPADMLTERVESMADAISNVQPELLHYYKSAVNRVGDSMGLTLMTEIGIDTEALIGTEGFGAGFAEIAKERGLRAALEDRRWSVRRPTYAGMGANAPADEGLRPTV